MTDSDTTTTADGIRQRTCAERLPSHLADRIADFRAMTRRQDPDEGDDELPPINEYPLGATVRYALRVDLSTGGPADYLTAVVDGYGDVDEIRYHFADWFDHAEERLENGSEDFIAAETFIDALYAGELAYFLREALDK